jgi:cobalt/nickel transport system permease protein
MRVAAMHISDGVLSTPVLLGGGAVAVAGVALGLRRMDYDRIPQVALLSAAFFAASTLHVPAGPGVSAHLVLNGVTGVILGWAAFPAFLVALALQAVLLQHGGLTTLGVNVVNMAAPAALCCWLFNRLVCSPRSGLATVGAFLAGALGVAGAAALTAASLALSAESFRRAALALFALHAPVMVIEGCVTVALVAFLRKTRPVLLHGPRIEDRSLA